MCVANEDDLGGGYSGISTEASITVTAPAGIGLIHLSSIDWEALGAAGINVADPSAYAALIPGAPIEVEIDPDFGAPSGYHMHTYGTGYYVALP